MEINYYKDNFKRKVIENVKTKKEVVSNKKRLSLEIGLINNGDFDHITFLNKNDHLINEISALLEGDLKRRFVKNINNLRKLSLAELLSKNNDYVNELKDSLPIILNEIGFLFASAKTYYNIETFLEKIDLISNEFVVVDDYFIKFLERIGFSKSEILEFCQIVAIENIKVCNKQMKNINQKKQEEKRIEQDKKLKQEKIARNKNLLSKKMSAETKSLLESVNTLLQNMNTDFTEEDMNMAIAYEEFLVKDMMDIPNGLLAVNDLEKYLIVLIWESFNLIEDMKTEKTEEELKEELDRLRILYNNTNYIAKRTVIYEDSNKEDFEIDNGNINVEFVIDEKNGYSYFENSVKSNKADYDFVKNANSMVEKLKKGINKQKKPINDVDDCYYIFQGLTYISIIMLNEENYIILTASKWDKLFTETRNIYNNNKEQIEQLKRQLVGDKYE